jgi:hypothetical protein
MNDKELLELAAKAAGITGVYAENSYSKWSGIRPWTGKHVRN